VSRPMFGGLDASTYLREHLACQLLEARMSHPGRHRGVVVASRRRGIVIP